MEYKEKSVPSDQETRTCLEDIATWESQRGRWFQALISQELLVSVLTGISECCMMMVKQIKALTPLKDVLIQ